MVGQAAAANFTQPQAGQKRPFNDCQEEAGDPADFPYIVFDTETTGLSLQNDKIVQLSMIKVFSKTHNETFNKYINPELSREYQLESKAFKKIHKIHPDFLKDQKTFYRSFSS